MVKPDGTEEDITSGGETQEISMKNNGVYLNGIYVVKVTTANNSKMGQITIRTLYGQDTYTRKFEKNISQTIDQLSQATEKYNTINELLRAKGKNSVEELLADASQDSMLMYMAMNQIYVKDQEQEITVYFIKNYGPPYAAQYTDSSQQQVSVEKYGGFYISRFEAGDSSANSSRNSSSGISGVTVSKKDAYIYNYVTREQASTLANGMYDTNSVKSQLITGAGWDRTLNWIVETNGKTEDEVFENSSNWGNYENSTENAATNSGSSNMNYITGRSEFWKANNIYDLAGNTWEWTTGTFSNYTERPCLCLGGSYDSYGNAQNATERLYRAEDYLSEETSFRVSIYLQP